ncbi:MAG: VWA domain-containing protein [Bdellovibrionota bacterium]
MFILFLILFLGACGKLPNYEVNSAVFGFSVSGEINPKVDILFVVDNSGSMSGNQSVLSASMADFIDNFSTKNLEFHIGVISTDQYCNPSVHSPVPNNSTCASYWSTGAYSGLYNNRYGSLLSKTSGEKFLTWLSSNYIGKFEDNVLLGTSGSGSEMPILSATTALEDPLLTGWNNGFFRSESFLSIIMVTDEDESSTEGPQTKLYSGSNLTPMNNRIDAFVDAVKSIKGASLPLFSVDVIARSPSTSTCAGNADKAYGLDYMVQRINAQYPAAIGELDKARFSSICTNFSSALQDIGASIVLSNARLSLTQAPANPAEIYVTNNGISVPNDTVNGWAYFASENYIQFYGSEIPSVGDQIVVQYTPGEPI